MIVYCWTPFLPLSAIYSQKGVIMISNFMEASGPLKEPLTNDYLFRALVQRNNRVLIALICTLLHIGEDTVLSAKVLNPIILGGDPGKVSVMPEVRITYRVPGSAYAGRFPDHLYLYASGILQVIRNERNGNPFREKDWNAFFQASTWEELQDLSEKSPLFRDAAMTVYELSNDRHIMSCCHRYNH